MQNPYDDSAPFPPEWEEPNSVNKLPPEVLRILFSQAPIEVQEKLANETRDMFKEVLARFSALAVLLGRNACERLVGNTDSGKGFHAMIRLNMEQSVIENAGLTVKEVEEVWDIYAGQINDFFTSIKTQNIDKGFGTE